MLRRVRTAWALLLGFAFSILSASLYAYEPPRRTGYITSTSSALKRAEVAVIDDALARYYEATNNTIAVLVVDSLGGEAIEDVVYDTATRWGVGDAQQDNGVLLVVAMRDRKSRIEVGEGLEGDLTDIESRFILDDVLRPSFRALQYRDGILRTVQAISKEISPGQTVDIGSVEALPSRDRRSPSTEG
ncbi:MAG: TPM domain-containing protein, partial [Myxococcota bacterium]